MRALVWAKVLETDPSASVRPPAESEAAHTRKAALSAATFKTLLALPQQQHPHDPGLAARDQLLLLLGGQLGLRAAELVGLDVDDLELTLGYLTVRGKGRKVRQVPLTARMVLALKRWLMLRAALNAVSPALLLSLSHGVAGGCGGVNYPVYITYGGLPWPRTRAGAMQPAGLGGHQGACTGSCC
ncbi:hypothetical protein GCM10022631_39390 [Deinococcus rubellus]|uniref:site-specific integrase n=1 Tax=Deinococcus rubellus TaxID=1889240 RepID=UPI003374953A